MGDLAIALVTLLALFMFGLVCVDAFLSGVRRIFGDWL